MSRAIKCKKCEKIVDHDYIHGGDDYYCEQCAQEIITWFNNLVKGNAGCTTDNSIAIDLDDLRRLMDMTVYNFVHYRFEITDEKRIEILGSCPL